jgi:hypothetical protein
VKQADIVVVLNNGTHVGDLHVIIWTESYWREVQKDIVNGTQPLSMAAKKGLIPSVTKSSLLPWVAFTSKFGLPVSKSLALYQTVGGALNEELVRGYSSLLLVPVLTGALFIVNPLWTQSFVILLYVVLRTMFVLAHPKDSRAPPVIISAAGLVGLTLPFFFPSLTVQFLSLLRARASAIETANTAFAPNSFFCSLSSSMSIMVSSFLRLSIGMPIRAGAIFVFMCSIAFVTARPPYSLPPSLNSNAS